MDIITHVKSLIVRNPLYEIAYNAINNKERPNYLSRSNNFSGFLEEFPKSKFTCLEIGKP